MKPSVCPNNALKRKKPSKMDKQKATGKPKVEPKKTEPKEIRTSEPPVKTKISDLLKAKATKISPPNRPATETPPKTIETLRKITTTCEKKATRTVLYQ
ncbi:unnamed protein product [Gongylonema pulchrum]|uniref:Titin n=1 Tax=Gongylonema pulchrum TaxID=637853 RepID=A0A183EQW0_9BILA|nr:unnamed protein product [Gongylonema pulchrum]